MTREEYYEDLKETFEGLKYDTSYDVCYEESEEEHNKLFNCIAYSLGFDDIWVWPLSIGITVYPNKVIEGRLFSIYWPVGIPKNLSMNAFEQMYALFGYERCTDMRYEPGYKKIIIYGYDAKEISHAAVVCDGYCMSKMGKYVIIKHQADSLIGKEYGQIIMCVRRKDNISNVRDKETLFNNNGEKVHVSLDIPE